MTERPKVSVSPIESCVILLNELSGQCGGPGREAFPGHYSEQVAKVLHGSCWQKWFNPMGGHPLRPEMFLHDTQRSQSLLDAVDRALESLSPRKNAFIRMRFGFQDGQLHTLKELSKELSLISAERARQITAKGLNMLRHHNRSRYFRKFLT